MRTVFMTLHNIHNIFIVEMNKKGSKTETEFTAAFKRVCGTISKRYYNIGNLSTMETVDFGVVKVKMKHIIDGQDEKKMEKDKEIARQLHTSYSET